MQAGEAARGVGTIPRRGRSNAVMAVAVVVAIAAALALAVWVVPLATSEVRAEDALPKAPAVSAAVHDDAGNVHPGAVPTVVHDDAGNMPIGAGSAVVHDDAGNFKPR